MALKFVLISALLGLSLAQFDLEDMETVKAFQTFKTKYNKSYSSSENVFRFGIFSKELKDIKEFNSGTQSYSQGISKYSDWTDEEKDRLNGVNYEEAERFLQTEDLEFESPSMTKQSVPSSINWNDKKCVTDVKDQGSCGSCWAFSANGAIESHRCINKAPLIGLSEQQLVDCSKEECNGGFMSTAYDYIKKNGGINTDSDYKYTGKKAANNQCSYDAKKTKQTVSGYTFVTRNDETAVQKTVGTIGPVASVIQVTRNFQRYKSGVFSDSSCNSKDYNHGVLTVGYGTENGVNYWLIKNSWGKGWGDKGYIKVAKDKGNMCCVACVTLYPKL